MPVIYFYSPDPCPPPSLLDAVCDGVAEVLSVGPEYVWAIWAPVQIGNARRPGWSKDQKGRCPPNIFIVCREVYPKEQIAGVLNYLRDTVANIIGCDRTGVFASVQRVTSSELLARGMVWRKDAQGGDMSTFEFEPIGIVRSPVAGDKEDGWGSVQCKIELAPNRFGPEALSGIEAFSHIEIIFLLDRVAPENVERGARHPRERIDWPKVGIFAQRAKSRPNRLGHTCCRLLKVEGRILTVVGLDAFDGSPVVDIKPYFPQFGPRDSVQVPNWATELMDGYF